MLPLIRTERLLLRPWNIDNVDQLHAMWTTPDVRRYLWDDIEITSETAKQVVDSHLATVERHDIGYWALELPPDSDRMIGFCGFRFIDEGSDVELMYGLLSEFWGRGLATEGCNAAVEYFWSATKYDVLYARTDPPNVASVRVRERLGMRRESTTDTLITYVLHRPS